ncbi:MAG: ABC transporter ATP-binding protein [Planctomycetota bacterium]
MTPTATATTEAAVELESVTIRYGDVLAVDQVSARLPRGCVGLLGRNGAGKSSILKALLGLVRPVSGRLSIAGLPSGVSPTRLRAHVGYMAERDGYIMGLNGYETVLMAGQLTGMPFALAARRAHEVLWFVELGEQRYRPVSSYSAGMRQKVKLAVALVHDPHILFLDEPTNGLDPEGRRDLLALIAQLADEFGKTVVLSTHILADVERVCREVVVLERGRLVTSGTIDALTKGVGRRFAVGVDRNEEAVVMALKAAGARAVEHVADRPLDVLLDDGVQLAAIFAAVAKAGACVRSLVEQRRSLAEVFLGAVDHERTATAADVGASPKGDGA